ncbi:hypothetical protein VNO80_05709 [Phaseolus coccineus]|uniref:Uncharacterized protein n=1 Tax=Phaseolus coccineus TaxID=3886 RepID=A0AAN9RIB3_PHACN
MKSPPPPSPSETFALMDTVLVAILCVLLKLCARSQPPAAKMKLAEDMVDEEGPSMSTSTSPSNVTLYV